jgi:NTP pyrophosphatase (non-canonical NTP hydrolase)
MFQPALPLLGPVAVAGPFLLRGQSLSEYQRFQVELDRVKGLDTNLYFNFMGLIQEMGQLSRALSEMWRVQTSPKTTDSPQPAYQKREQSLVKHSLEQALADCMAYLLKLANYSGIDLERAYLDKIQVDHSV